MDALTPARLRAGLALFFVALALPAAVLVITAHDRLKWEAFHQYRGLAEELAARIDARAAALVRAEEARTFADYGFLVLAGDARANFVQRSPLAAFPVDDALPGLIGHFQVDADGALSTPLLPRDADAAARYGVGDAERAQRAALAARIRAILTENRLVGGRGELPAAARAAPPDRGSGAAAVARNAVREAMSAAPAAHDAAELAPPAGAAAERVAELEADGPAAARSASPQAAFDQLERAPGAQTAPGTAAIGRVDELKLEQPFARAPAPASAAGPARQRTTRKEQVAIPAAVADAGADAVAGAGADAGADIGAAAPVRTFEGELDPVAAATLDSGHLVLFRKVWRDGQRYIQGALVDRARFVERVAESAYRGTALSRTSNLAVAWRGEVFAAYGAASAPRHLSSGEELAGALLYRTRLSAPLADMELVFTLARLPAGPGARVVTWMGVTLALVLCAGTALLYRLGARQIELARQQRDFVSAVSHELRTPLTSIRMYAEMLREGWAGEDKRQGYYAFIHDESERLSRLIANVLQLARIGRGEPDVRLTRMSAGALLDHVRSKVASQAERAGFALSVQCDRPAAAACVQVDADAFSQVVINLVDNALKFSAHGARAAVEIGCRLDGARRVVFSVRDHGPGIARDQRRKIFGLFYRGGSELTRETAGTGIGLALVQRLCAAMGAQVDVEDANPGARFTIAFARDA